MQVELRFINYLTFMYCAMSKVHHDLNFLYEVVKSFFKITQDKKIMCGSCVVNNCHLIKVSYYCDVVNVVY